MARHTIYLPDDVTTALTDDLDHGDSLSARIQEAVVAHYDIERRKQSDA